MADGIGEDIGLAFAVFAGILLRTEDKSLMFPISQEEYAHGESNPNQRNRNPSFYPLNYERMFLNAAAKIHIIFYITKSFAYFS